MHIKQLTIAIILIIYANAAFASALSDAANGGVGVDARSIYREAIGRCSSPDDESAACLSLLSSLPDNYEDSEYYLGLGYQKEADFAKQNHLLRADIITSLDNSYKAFNDYATKRKRYSTDSYKRASEVGRRLLSVLREDVTEKIESVDHYINSLKKQSIDPENDFYNARMDLAEAEAEMKMFDALKNELNERYHINSISKDNSLNVLFNNLENKYKKIVVDSGYENKMYEALSEDRQIELKLKKWRQGALETDERDRPDWPQYNKCRLKGKNECKERYGYGSRDYSICAYKAQEACAYAYGTR